MKLEAALRQDLKAQEATIKAIEAGLKRDMMNLKRDLKEMEQKLTIKLGVIVSIGVTVLAVLFALLTNSTPL